MTPQMSFNATKDGLCIWLHNAMSGGVASPTHWGGSEPHSSWFQISITSASVTWKKVAVAAQVSGLAGRSQGQGAGSLSAERRTSQKQLQRVI